MNYEAAIGAILAGLGGYRLALLLVDELGPFRVFEHLRRAAGVPHVGFQAPKPLIGGILSCTFCCSVWTASALFAVGWWLSWIVVAIVAAWGVAAFALDSAQRRAGA